MAGGSHKGPFGPKIEGRTRAWNCSSVIHRPAVPERAVASWSRARRSSGRSGTGGSAAAQRPIATCVAAVTAPARIRGYMSWSRSVPVLAAIAEARASCIAEVIFRYSPRMAGAVTRSASRSSAPSQCARTVLTRASHSGSPAGRASSSAPMRRARSVPMAQIASYLLEK